MKFKLKILAAAAAVALAAASGAQAAVDFTSGNGDLFVNLTTPAAAAGNGSASFDLGFTMSQSQTWNGVSGLTLQWNLSTGAFTSNNAGIAASNPTLGSYGSALSTFQGNSAYALGTAQLSVLAMDHTDNAVNPGTAGSRIMSTSNIISASGTGTQPGATFGPTNSQFFNAMAPNVTVGGFEAGVNVDPGMAAAVGASTAVNGDADYYNNGTGMQAMGVPWTGWDNAGLYGGQFSAGGILGGQDKSLPFFMMYSNGLSAATRVSREAFGVDLDGDGTIEFDNNGATTGGSNEFGLWTLQGDVLTYMNPELSVAAIPEPGTYAMMLAGLALLGGIARRRLS